MEQRARDYREDCATPSERRSSRRYVVEMVAAGSLYVVSLFASLWTVESTSGPLKVADALLPMIGVLAMVVAIVRFIGRLDELQRRTFVLSGALAACGTAIVAMALGFLENAGVPRISLTWMFPLTAILFGLALPFVRRRYL